MQEGGFFGLRGAVGTPEQIRDYLARYEECGVDQVIFCSQAGKNRHEHIMESLELFGTRGAARVPGARRAARSGDKAKRLEPVIDAAMARKPASDHPPLPTADYEFPAIPRVHGRPLGGDDFHRGSTTSRRRPPRRRQRVTNLIG